MIKSYYAPAIEKRNTILKSLDNIKINKQESKSFTKEEVLLIQAAVKHLNNADEFAFSRIDSLGLSNSNDYKKGENFEVLSKNVKILVFTDKSVMPLALAMGM